jgi:hypothetical protein
MCSFLTCLFEAGPGALEKIPILSQHYIGFFFSAHKGSNIIGQEYSKTMGQGNVPAKKFSKNNCFVEPQSQPENGVIGTSFFN